MPARVPQGAALGFIDWRWEARDHHLVVTFLTLVGVAVAGAMALFGLPPVDLHGPLHRFGIMDPLCGGTRAARYTAQGEWALAWQYNPLGVIAVLGAAAGAVRAAVGALSGRWLTARFHWTPWRRRVILAIVVALLLALEVRQQLRVDLLTQDTWMFR